MAIRQLIVRRVRIWLGVIVVLVAVAAAGLWAYLRLAGDAPHFAGRCETVPLAGSAEDIQIDHARGFAYLSLLDRRALVRGEPAQGRIGRLNLASAPPRIEAALIDPPAHFRPHGISLYIAANGTRSLFVINHPVERGVEPERVEQFREESPGRFRHVQTYTDPLLTSPNDLVAVGPDSFYVANDSMSELTNLVFVDSSGARVVASDIASGGGINVSADGRTLYVAETRGDAIRVMRRNPADGSVETTGSIPLGTAPDNIDIAADGSLWVAAHSNLVALIMHFMLGSDAPTQVLHITNADHGSANIEEIYLNRGDEISAGSVGATWHDQLLIGSITAKHILLCDRATANSG